MPDWRYDSSTHPNPPLPGGFSGKAHSRLRVRRGRVRRGDRTRTITSRQGALVARSRNDEPRRAPAQFAMITFQRLRLGILEREQVGQLGSSQRGFSISPASSTSPARVRSPRTWSGSASPHRAPISTRCSSRRVRWMWRRNNAPESGVTVGRALDQPRDVGDHEAVVWVSTLTTPRFGYSVVNG